MIEAAVYAVFSIALAALILYIFSKPLKTLIYIFGSRKIRAGIVNVPIPDGNGIPLSYVPVAVYEDESGEHTLILRKDDFFSYGGNLLRDGRNVTIFVGKDDDFTTLYHFFRTLIQAVLLAAMPALLLSGTAGMLYYEITDYGLIQQLFG